jgi:hypothetical protein
MGRRREHGLEAFLHELDDAAGVGALELLALRPRHPQEGQGAVPAQGPAHPAVPEPALDAVRVDLLPLLRVVDLEEGLDVFAQLARVDVGVGEAREQAGGAPVVERGRHASGLEGLQTLVPHAPRRVIEERPQVPRVQGAEVVTAPLAEELEEALEVQGPDAGDLEVQQRVLPRVHVDRVDVPGVVERVVEGVAARRRDHHELVVRLDREGLTVETRVFPAGVVDEVVVVHPAEGLLAAPLQECRHRRGSLVSGW